MNTTIATTTTCNTTAAVSYVKALARFQGFRSFAAAETDSSAFEEAREDLVRCAACAEFVNARWPALALPGTQIGCWYYTSRGRYARVGAEFDVGSPGRYQSLVV